MILAQNHAALESIGRDQWAQVYGDFYTPRIILLDSFCFSKEWASTKGAERWTRDRVKIAL